MNVIAAQLTLVFAVLATFFVGPGAAIGFLLIRRRSRRARQWSLIGIDLLRGPGQTVHEQLEQATNDLMWDVVALCVSPLILLTMYLTQWRFGLTSNTGHTEIIYGWLGIGVIAWLVRKMLKAGERIDDLRAGFDAKLAVGQELDQLMRTGAAVFHDFPADGFSIDHIVISLQGVFAIETKGYTQPIGENGKVNATVVFDGHTLKFPSWTTSEPLEHAERQAKWLSRWATSAIGGLVVSTPVLALPGWFVDRKGRSIVRVYSGRALGSLLETPSKQPLSEQDVQRIAHQVEQRCRAVVPTYRRDDEKI